MCQTLLTCLHVEDFPTNVFYNVPHLTNKPVIIDLILFCKKTYSSLANNLEFYGRKMTIAFFYLVFS